MRVGSVLAVALGLAALAGACGRDGLHSAFHSSTDAAPPGPPSRDADAASDGTAPGGDAPGADAPDAVTPRHGRRSFVVSSTFRSQGDGGLPIANRHSFTIVFDVDEGVAVIGSTGGGATLRLEAAGGLSFNLRGKVSFALEELCDDEVVYEGMSVTMLAEGVLTGKAEGLVRYTRMNLVETVPVAMDLSGVSDGEAPRLSFASDGSPRDPFWWIRLFASEPLPDIARLTLVANSGEILDLARIHDRVHGRLEFRPPPVMLRFGETYRVTLPGEVDFAGNVARQEPRFTTREPPALVVEDGFESATAPDLGGALVIDDSTLPVIAGKKSVYVPPRDAQPLTAPPLLLMRLEVQPGDTVIRFSYRTVDVPRGAANGIALGFGVASVGKTRGGSVPFEVNQPKETLERPDHTQLLLGPLYQAKIFLLPDTTDEVVVSVYSGTAACKLPTPPQQGIIIDDVRVE